MRLLLSVPRSPNAAADEASALPVVAVAIALEPDRHERERRRRSWLPGGEESTRPRLRGAAIGPLPARGTSAASAGGPRVRTYTTRRIGVHVLRAHAQVRTLDPHGEARR